MLVITPDWWVRWLAIVEELWPAPWRGELARRYLIAIALQESGLMARRQRPGGPARSYWQIEPQTVGLLLSHQRLGPILLDIAGALDIEDHYALEYADAWSATLARALLRALPDPLSEDPATAWEHYLRAWRPGRPRPETWPRAWDLATRAIDRG